MLPPRHCSEDYGDTDCPPEAHGWSQLSRYTQCSLWRTTQWSGWRHHKGSCDCGESTPEQAPGRGCSLWRGPHEGHIFWQDLWPCERRMLQQFISEGLHSMERFCAGTVLEEKQPVGRTHTGEVNEGLSPMGKNAWWSREEWGGRSSRLSARWTDCNCHVPLLSTICGEKVKKPGVKWSPGRRERLGKAGETLICSSFSLPCSV